MQQAKITNMGARLSAEFDAPQVFCEASLTTVCFEIARQDDVLALMTMAILLSYVRKACGLEIEQAKRVFIAAQAAVVEDFKQESAR